MRPARSQLRCAGGVHWARQNAFGRVGIRKRAASMIYDGMQVCINYRGVTSDGYEFENTFRSGIPLSFVMGENQLLPRLEMAIRQMKPGDSQHVHLSAREAFGPYRRNLVMKVPVSSVPNIEDYPVGEYVILNTDAGSVRIKVLKIEDGMLYLDQNHELAGKDLDFYIDLDHVHTPNALAEEQHKHGEKCSCEILRDSLQKEN